MSELIDRLKARWVADGLRLRPGASAEALDDFEARYRIVLPAALRDYFEAVDGMTEDLDGDDWPWDSDTYRFWPLSALHPVGEVRTIDRGDPAWADHWFAFADYLINSHALAVRLGSDGADAGPVCLSDFGDVRIPIAPTFEAFLELYLARSMDLFGSDAKLKG